MVPSGSMEWRCFGVQARNSLADGDFVYCSQYGMVFGSWLQKGTLPIARLKLGVVNGMNGKCIERFGER